VAGEVYLDEAELHSYQAGKVVYNCLLADRFAKNDRPVKGDLQNGWPREIRLRVLDRWTAEYGYGAQSLTGRVRHRELCRPRCVIGVTRPSSKTPNRRK
jgi:hypothetical protein